MGRIINVLKKVAKNPRSVIRYLNTSGMLNFLSDKTCLRLLWWAETGTRLNLNNPIGFNEKLQWLKVYDHRPEYTKYVDKVLVRDYVKKTIGEKYLVPIIGVFDHPEQLFVHPDQLVQRIELHVIRSLLEFVVFLVEQVGQRPHERVL